MSPSAKQAGLIMLALALAACTLLADPPTTTQAGDLTTTAGHGTTTTTLGRKLTMVDCETPPPSVAIVCEAYELIQENYVDEIDDDALGRAALTTLETLATAPNDEELVCAIPTDEFEDACRVASQTGLSSAEIAEAVVTGLATHALDPNSAYFDVASLALLEEEQEGEIEGIGALVSPEDETLPGENKQCSIVSDTCRLLIVSTIEGAPADEAGLRRDDAIVGVDGVSITGWTIDEVTAAVRGPAGSSVRLTIDRGGDRFEVELVRAAVLIPVLTQELVDDTGYIHLHLFSDNADEQFETAVADLLAEGVDALVIDLRDNPGGLLETAIEVTSTFLPAGEVVVTEGPDSRIPYQVTGDAIVPTGIELIMLVNKGSASASEVVSAVLQETGRATVVGENTFGKNTVQQRFGLSNGGALKLTIARWLTPGGLDFGGIGVTPDIEMAINTDLDTAELVAAVRAAT